MANTSAWNEDQKDSFKNKLLQLQIHRCTVCKNTLKKPILTDPENGCNYCFCCKTGENLVHNNVLEDILNQLFIPCKYESNGCTTKVNYWALKSHEEVCIKRKFDCPLKWTIDCKWQGSMSAILDHCNANHQENVIKVSSILTLDVEEGLKEVIVIKESNVFVVRLQHTEQTACEVYFLGEELLQSFSFSFVVNNCDTNPKDVLMYALNTFCQNITDIRGAFLENPNRNRINIRIFSSDTESDEDLSTFFECPVCKHVMSPPIFQCLTGHSICHSCKPKLSSCGICQNNFGNVRNYSLEALCSKIRVPCLHNDKGCTVVSSASIMDQHEDECTFRTFTCPLNESNCCWEGQLINLSTHLRSNHREKTFYSGHRYASKYESRVNNYISDSIFEQSCMLVFGQVFRLYYQKDNRCDPKWSLQFIGPKKDAKKFRYKIELVDESDTSKTTAKSSKCHAMNNATRIEGAGYLSITNNVMSWFVRNGKIVYRCHIQQLPA